MRSRRCSGALQWLKGAGRVEKLCGAIMVILMCRRSPARRGFGADAPQVLQRTAELIPNQLRFSALPTLHPCGSTAESRLGGTLFTAHPRPRPTPATMSSTSKSIEHLTSQIPSRKVAPAGCSVDDVGKLNQSGMRPAVRRCPHRAVARAEPSGDNRIPRITMTTPPALGAPKPAPAQYFPIESVLCLLRSDRPNRPMPRTCR